MNDCFLNLLFSFQLLLPLKEGADFVGSKQTIDVILSDLSLLGYVIPVGGLGIGLFICLLAYLAAEYNVRFQSHEKYKIAMNMLHSIHTPLTLLRNQLEDIKTASLSEPVSLKIEEVLKYAERIIDCNQNVMSSVFKCSLFILASTAFDMPSLIWLRCSPCARNTQNILLVSAFLSRLPSAISLAHLYNSCV